MIMGSFKDALTILANALKTNTYPQPEITARHLLAYATGLSFTDSWNQTQLSVNQEAVVHGILRQINMQVPVAQIIGNVPFRDCTLKITPDVLIPRPETEELITKVMQEIKHTRKKDLHILEVGTGSGCIITSLASELEGKLHLTGIEPSTPAWYTTTNNLSSNIGISFNYKGSTATANKNNLRIKIVNLGIQTWKCTPGCKFDLLISNPPYLTSHEYDQLPIAVKSHEPRTSLDGGEDGLNIVRYIWSFIERLTTPVPHIIMELSPTTIHKAKEIAEQKNYKCEIALDSFGRERFLTCRH